MASLRWTKWLLLLVHVLWASNIVAALPPPTYVYHVTGKQPQHLNRRPGISLQTGGMRWRDFTATNRRSRNNVLYAPLGYQEVRQALRAWAAPASSASRLHVGQPPILYAIRPGPSTVNGPQDGSFYQSTGWPRDQLGWYFQLPGIGGRSPSQQAIRDMSDEALDQYIGTPRWNDLGHYCHLAAARLTQPLLRNNNPDDQLRVIDEIVKTAADELCGNRNPGPPPTGDQAANPGPSTRQDCERKSAEISKELTPDSDPARWEEVAWQMVNACAPSQVEASEEPVPGPSGLQQQCKKRVEQNLKPVIEKFKGQKRPYGEMIAETQQAICSQSSSDTSSDEPPPTKSKGVVERCNQDTSNVLGIFNDNEAAAIELVQYLQSSGDALRDLCHTAGIYEFNSDFLWENPDNQGQDEAALPAEPEQQQQGQEQQQQGQEQQQQQQEQEQQDEEDGVRRWPRFLHQLEQRFHVHERRLLAYLDENNGLSSLQQDYAPIYNLLQQTFPDVLDVLRQIGEAGITFSSCLPQPPSSPKARANQDRKDELCAKVLAAIGESAQAPGNQPKENDKTPSTSPSTPPDEAVPDSPQDNTAPEIVKAIAAFGIPLAGAGLGAFVASTAGEALLASTAASLGIGAGVGTAEGVQAAVSTFASSLTRTVGQAVQRALTVFSRLGHRVSNPLLRRLTSSAVRAATRRAAERIPLLP